MFKKTPLFLHYIKMQTFQDFAARLEKAVRALEDSEVPDAVKATSDLRALVQNRVVSTGITSSGAAFPAYSTRPISKAKLIGKSRTSGADQRVKKERGPVSYRRFRELNNLQVSHRDFYFTGDMWRGVGIRARRQGSKVIGWYGGTRRSSVYKLQKNSEQMKINILKPNNIELAMVRQAWAKRRANAIASILR